MTILVPLDCLCRSSTLPLGTFSFVQTFFCEIGLNTSANDTMMEG
jgi:hypothetical protein